ncbi:MAG: hypothetical protein P8Y80_10255 [Acidobacteriota bacterium]
MTFLFLHEKRKLHLWAVSLLVVLLTAVFTATQYGFLLSDIISPEKFTGIIQEFSEPGGYFQSDNFISNEEEYLKVLDKMKELGASGGAYIGVGPEQNFTYIARIKPKIAFIVDIRRQAMIQQLFYKALFHLCPDRTEFLSRLLSRPLKGPDAPRADAAMDALMRYFSLAPPDDHALSSNLAEIKKIIQEDFKFPLSEDDRMSLDYIGKSFRDDGVFISFEMDSFRGRGRGRGHFPTMREILEQRDSRGKYGNFLASDEDYSFVRDLQKQNRIIPIVGNFAGTKAIKSIAGYLEQQSIPVSVFYISNVEQFLFQYDEFEAFLKNVKTLPIRPNSLLIRSIAGMYRTRPRWPMMETFLQNLPAFIKNYDAGLYPDYYDLVNTEFISVEP